MSKPVSHDAFLFGILGLALLLVVDSLCRNEYKAAEVCILISSKIQYTGF